jgi:hypothetical protein
MLDIPDNKKEKYFKWIFIIIYSCYIITFLGLISINSTYLTKLRSFIEVISCILLIIRFNPMVSHIMTSFDRTMIFSVATFLLCNIIISELYIYFSNVPIVNTLYSLQKF